MPAHFQMDSERRGHINRPTSLMGSVVGVKGNTKPSGMVSNGNAVNKYTNGSTRKQPLPPPPDISNNSHSNSGKSEQRSSQKRGKGWLGLCYPSLGSGKGRTGAVSSGSESPSPTDSDRDKNGKTDKEDGENSETDDESPTDGGFKIPNSQSNERPTSLPVALQLNSSRLNQPIIHGEVNTISSFSLS